MFTALQAMVKSAKGDSGADEIARVITTRAREAVVGERMLRGRQVVFMIVRHFRTLPELTTLSLFVRFSTCHRLRI